METKNFKQIGYEKFRCFVCYTTVTMNNYICSEDKKCFSYSKIIKGCECGKFKEN